MTCPGVFFQLFAINHGEKAMQGYGLTYVLYEVLDLNEKIENDIDLSGLEVIVRRDFGLEVTRGEFQPEQKMQKQELKAQDIETCLKEIVSHSKKQNSKDKVQETFSKDKKQSQKEGKQELLHHMVATPTAKHHKEFHMASPLREGQNKAEWDQLQLVMVARILSLPVKAS